MGRYDHLDKNNKLIWNFRDITHTMRRIAEGKASQKRVLILLKESGGMTQKALTDRLGVQPGTVSEVLWKLETAGLICRSQNTTDRRTTDVALTEQGAIMAEEAYHSREARHEQMFAVLTEDEKDTLLHLLEKINTDWSCKYQVREKGDSSDRKNPQV